MQSLAVTAVAKSRMHTSFPGRRVGHSPDLEHLGRPIRRAKGGSHRVSPARSSSAATKPSRVTVPLCPSGAKPARFVVGGFE